MVAQPPVQSYITAIASVPAANVPRLKAALAGLNASSASTIGRISTIHFARWALIDNETRLLFCVEFDGSFDAYIEEFVAKGADGLDLIFGNCEGYPAGGARNIEAFKAYIHAHDFGALLFYSAYPAATVKDVQTSLRVRANLEALLDDFQTD